MDLSQPHATEGFFAHGGDGSVDEGDFIGTAAAASAAASALDRVGGGSASPHHSALSSEIDSDGRPAVNVLM
jgi:hypothetical protein